MQNKVCTHSTIKQQFLNRLTEIEKPEKWKTDDTKISIVNKNNDDDKYKLNEQL